MRAGLVSRRGCGRAEAGWLPALCNAAVCDNSDTRSEFLRLAMGR